MHALPTNLHLACLLGVAAGLASHDVGAETIGGRHEWTLDSEFVYADGSSPLEPWTDHGAGKLRDEGFAASRMFAEYRGRITTTLSARAVFDYSNDASAGLDLTEAYLEWRPLPTSAARQQWRIGAFYPRLSLENRDDGWRSPFTFSYSAINTWLGEEIRPVGAEWTLRHRPGTAGSPHEIELFVAGFYGNDPAATLLFWRGWSLHDRQSRLGDRLPLAPMPIRDAGGEIIGQRPQSYEPFVEIDDRPGMYSGLEWRYARRALIQLAHYDNRADPEAFGSGQWGWDTSFSQLAVQLELAADLGLIMQWMRGETRWIAGAAFDGTIPAFATLVEEPFESRFWLLTRSRGGHRWSIRHDRFDYGRYEAEPAFNPDRGRAWTLAYMFRYSPRATVGVEWVEIDSARDLWTEFYGLPRRASERELRLQLRLQLY